ncbi:MAG: response regulator [Calditrichaeota bacterium]|nr:response regulator [Candidatus Cloacimonadota bacterium]MCA9787275.1 response regulator [Candidatus Cloacimonadota bacterium]MCB1046518.1 response regulator [Calditrichota bacterium]
MAAEEKVLVISRNDRWAEDLDKELRREGYRTIHTVRQPLDALPEIWEGAPLILVLDTKNMGPELYDVLRLCRDNGKPLAKLVAVARGNSQAGSAELTAQKDDLETFGVMGCLDSGASVVAMIRELLRLRDQPVERETDGNETQAFSMILFLNDRQRVESVCAALEGDKFHLRVVNDFNALSGEFMSAPPDMVLIDPRGVTRALGPLANLSRLFPHCGINFIVPADLSESWKRKQPDYVGTVYSYPEDEQSIRKLGQNLYALLRLARQDTGKSPATRPMLEQSSVVPTSLRGKELEQRLRNINDTILLVDDDDEFRSVIAQYLRLIHYTVLQAENGEEALRLLKQNKVSLVISDIYMPRMNGFQLYLHLRNRYPGLPAILMTGYNRTLEEVAPGYLEDAIILNKPFSLQNLDPLIRNCLDT